MEYIFLENGVKTKFHIWRLTMDTYLIRVLYSLLVAYVSIIEDTGIVKYIHHCLDEKKFNEEKGNWSLFLEMGLEAFSFIPSLA